MYISSSDFENRFAAHFGAEYRIGAGNGPDALTIFLKNLYINVRFT